MDHLWTVCYPHNSGFRCWEPTYLSVRRAKCCQPHHLIEMVFIHVVFSSGTSGDVFKNLYLSVSLEVSCVICRTLNTYIKVHLPAGVTGSKHLLPVAPGRNCVTAGPVFLWDFRGLQVRRLLEGDVVAPPRCHICVGPPVMYTGLAETLNTPSSAHFDRSELQAVKLNTFGAKTMSKLGKPAGNTLHCVQNMRPAKSVLQISRREVSTGKEQCQC